MIEISLRLKRAADYIRSLGYFPAYISLYGSQNYGLSLDSPEYVSDYDFKCVVLPSFREIVEEKDCISLAIDFDDGQIDVKDIRLFTRLIGKMNPAYLECLMTENYLILPDGENMQTMRSLLPALFSERGAAFARVCVKLFEEKKKRLHHDSPAQAENIAQYGYDLKQAHHMYRLLVMLRAFEQTGQMQLLPPEEEKTQLLALKMGVYNLEEVLNLIQTWYAEILGIEARIAAAYRQEKDETIMQLEKLRMAAVYQHCRREVLDHGEVSI